MHYKYACVIKAGTLCLCSLTMNTLEWCQLNALQASPVVHWVTPLSCVSLPGVHLVDTSLVCFTVNEYTTKISRYRHLTSIWNPILEIRRSYDRLISTLGFPLLVRWHLYIESGSCTFLPYYMCGSVLSLDATYVAQCSDLGNILSTFFCIGGVLWPMNNAAVVLS